MYTDTLGKMSRSRKKILNCISQRCSGKFTFSRKKLSNVSVTNIFNHKKDIRCTNQRMNSGLYLLLEINLFSEADIFHTSVEILFTGNYAC